MIFRLHYERGNSSPSPAETNSLYCRLLFCFQLLSTPHYCDAVTFSYGVMAYADRDLHPASFAPSWAHSFRHGLPESTTAWMQEVEQCRSNCRKAMDGKFSTHPCVLDLGNPPAIPDRGRLCRDDVFFT